MNEKIKLLSLIKKYPIVFINNEFYIGTTTLSDKKDDGLILCCPGDCFIKFDEKESIFRMILTYFEKYRNALYRKVIHISEEVDNAFLYLLGIKESDADLKKMIARHRLVQFIKDFLKQSLGDSFVILANRVAKVTKFIKDSDDKDIYLIRNSQKYRLEYVNTLDSALSELETKIDRHFSSAEQRTDPLSDLFRKSRQLGHVDGVEVYIMRYIIQEKKTYFFAKKVPPHIMRLNETLYCFRPTIGGVIIPVIRDKISFAGYSPDFFILDNNRYNHPSIEKDYANKPIKKVCLPYHKRVNNLDELREFLDNSINSFCEGYSSEVYNKTRANPWVLLTPENFEEECNPNVINEFRRKYPWVIPIDV